MKERRKIGAVYGALVFDLRVADPRRKRSLEADEAAALALALRRNLNAECGEIRALRLVLAPAFYDPCALLRPGRPLHRRLRALRTSGRSHDGDKVAPIGRERLPEPRGFDPGRELLSLPFVLEGRADDARAAARRLDENRMRTYIPRAGHPAQEWPTMPAFDAVGYLSLRSLSAEIGARYYAQGLGDVWNLIDRVLREPDREHVLDARTPQGGACTLRYAEGRVRVDGGGDTANIACRRLLAAHGLKTDAAQDIQATADAITVPRHDFNGDEPT